MHKPRSGLGNKRSNNTKQKENFKMVANKRPDEKET